jgi:hypothetical protein
MESNKIKRGAVREDGMILLKRYAGEEIWVTREHYDKYIKSYKKHIAKRMMDYRNNGKRWRVGEFNPENGLYFLRNNGAYRPIFGTLEQLAEHRRKVAEKTTKYWKNRKPFIRTRKRGDIDPVLNLIFWRYNCRDGTELWLTPEKFKVLWERSKEQRKNASKKKTGHTEGS